MHKTMRSLLFPFIVISSTLLVACGSIVPVVRPFKMDIQQGNVVTSKMLLQLRPGMTKSQVKFIMGTPLVVDSFHTNRWDYFYQLRQAGKVVEQRRVILDFEKDLLARVRGDVVPQGTPGADTGSVTLAKEPLPAAAKPAEKEGVFENLKFWKSRDPAKEDAPKNNETKPAPVPVAPLPKPAEAVPAQTQESDPNQPAPEAATGSESPEATPAAETPSLLAVPIVIPPADDPSVERKPEDAPATNPATADPPANESKPIKESAPPVKEPAPIVEPEKVAPSVPDSDLPAKKDDEFIFRLERNLNTKDIELNTPVKKPNPSPSDKGVANSDKAPVKGKAVESEPAPVEEEPGYFEKMLEKIGF